MKKPSIGLTSAAKADGLVYLDRLRDAYSWRNCVQEYIDYGVNINIGSARPETWGAINAH